MINAEKPLWGVLIKFVCYCKVDEIFTLGLWNSTQLKYCTSTVIIL